MANDPVNAWDPSGLAQCGDLKGDRCLTALDDAQNARDAAYDASEQISKIADKVDAGDTLSDTEQKIVDVIKGKFGDDYGSAKNLRSVAKALDQVGDKIGPRGRGVLLNQGDNTSNAPAYTLSDNKWAIFYNDSYFDSSDPLWRERTNVHEGVHLIFDFDLVDIYEGPKLDAAVAARNRNPQGSTLRFNPDSYACSVPKYSGTCK